MKRHSRFRGDAADGFAEALERDADRHDSGGRLMLVRAVVRSFPWVLVLILLGAAVGLAIGLSQPNTYVSNATLSLRVGAREQLTSESLVELAERQTPPLPTMLDEMQMLGDVAIYERVARELGPDAIFQVADPGRDDGPHTPALVRLLHRVQGYMLRSTGGPGLEPGEERLRKATKALRGSTTVSNSPGSSVILVSNTSTSPEMARTVVQALVDEFIRRHREHYSILALREKSRSQLEEATSVLEGASKAYIEQVGQSGIVELEAQAPRLETELRALESDLFAARMRGEEIVRLRTSLSNRLQGIPAEIEVQRASVMIPNEEYETQLALKRMLYAQRQEMLIEERPSEERRRREREFDNQIAKIEQRLLGTPKTIEQGSELMQENLGHSAIEARVVDLDVENEALPRKLELLQARVDMKRASLTEVQRKLLAATMLRRDLSSTRDVAERRYGYLRDRNSVLEALENIDANEGANLRVLQAPTLEYEKVGPKRLSLLLQGLLAGILAAGTFALLRQRLDRRLCHPDTFEDARDVPVLGVVPHLSALRSLKRGALARRA